ncbi:MAG: DmsC/YnfH family molybdoenzyme membrane anchor subunit [Bacteroidales bacterium]
MTGSTWSLVFFTLFAQAAFGLIVALAVFAAGKQPVVRIVYVNVRTLVTGIALVLMAAALVFSFFHLGSPEKALYAASNLRSSWLSREILVVSVFSVVLLVWYIMQKADAAGKLANRYMRNISVLAGALMVFTMARLYMVPTIPAWDSAGTLVLFYSSGILLGTPFLLALIIPSYITGPERPGYYFFIPVMAILIISAFLVRILFMFFHDPAIENPALPPADIPLLLYVFHYIFLTAGITLITLRIFFLSGTSARAWKLFLLLSLVFIFTGEIIGRYIFYAGYFRVGV